MTIDYSPLPEHVRDGMRRYIEQHVLPGAFLTSVLANDLQGAVANANHVNRERLPEYVIWLHTYAPADCYGSYDAVHRWTKQRRVGTPV